MFLSKYGVARHIRIPIVKRGVVDFAVGADWTPAAGDVKISLDGGAAANVTNLPTAIAMGNTAIWDFSFTAAEITAAQIVITVADAATKAVEDQTIEIETYGNASAQHAFDLGTASTAQSGDNYPRIGAPAGASIAADIAAIKTEADTILNDVNVGAGALYNRIGAPAGASIAADIAALPTAAIVKTQMVNALTSDTYAEPAAVPAATATLKDKIGWLCSLARNKLTQTAATQLLRNDGDTATIGTSAVSDDGTTFTRGKFA